MPHVVMDGTTQSFPKGENHTLWAQEGQRQEQLGFFRPTGEPGTATSTQGAPLGENKACGQDAAILRSILAPHGKGERCLSFLKGFCPLRHGLHTQGRAHTGQLAHLFA